MKKKLVVLLAVVMMFAFSASAYAATFSDVSERPVVEQDAIKKAVALGIIEGYEDGTFGPDKTITRAEFAKIAVTAAGAKETATMLESNASAFKDVRANSWYTGWINAAESLGIFKGDTNGNFRPNDTISNQEAITVMLRLLGYNDNLTGTWPVNYVTKANQIGILDDVSIVASAAAKRGDIVVMLGDALDTPIVTYDKDTNEFVYKQTTKSGSSYITLLDDSFEGSFIEVDGANRFNAVDQVRNVADRTLNWTVVGNQSNLSTETNENKVNKNANFNGTLIIDDNTSVSYNAEGLFDLQGHQGKVYYVTENDRKYARFIEVESYIQTASDKVEPNGTNKVKVSTTNYNAYNPGWSEDAKAGFKNSNYKMYFNDDDQVYWVASDRDYTDKAYYVKALTTASARLVGTKTKTVNMNDADTLIYADGVFVSPSDLEVGDAIVEIREGELYVKVADQSGDFTRTEYAAMAKPKDDTYQHKATIGGKKYVFEETTEDAAAVETYGIKTRNPIFYEENLEVAGITSEDVYNNNVKFLLNKDNSIAAIIVDETSAGTTLYGVVVDGGGNSGTWNKSMDSITLFTQEGYTVTYDFDKNCTGKPSASMARTDETGRTQYVKGAGITYDPSEADKDENGNAKFVTVGGVDSDNWEYDVAKYFMGQPVAYKLNSNGEIKVFQKLTNLLATTDGEEVEVKNNAYLVNGNKSVSLASNVVIFEVSDDKEEIDVSLVTRSSLLSGGDFTVENVDNIRIVNKVEAIPAYAKYDLNSNNAVKALAYTNTGSTDYHYGVIKAWKFTDADHAGILANGNDYAITFVGDDKVYDLDLVNSTTQTGDVKAGADKFVLYTLSGDKVTVKAVYGNDAALKTLAKLVTGYNDGLITVGQEWAVFDDQRKTNVDVNGDPIPGKPQAPAKVYEVMTDANTAVYIIDSNSGDYREGSLSDISRNSYVFVPVIDTDGYADVVLVDEYPHSSRPDGGSTTVTTGTVSVTEPSSYSVDGYSYTTAPGTVSDPVYTIDDNEVKTAKVTFTLTGDAADTMKSGNYKASFGYKVTVKDKDDNTVKTMTGTTNIANFVVEKDYNYTVEFTVDFVK